MKLISMSTRYLREACSILAMSFLFFGCAVKVPQLRTELTIAEKMEARIVSSILRSCPNLTYNPKLSAQVREDTTISLVTNQGVMFPNHSAAKGLYDADIEKWESLRIDYPSFEYCHYYTQYWVVVLTEDEKIHFFYGWVDQEDIDEYLALKKRLL